MAASAVVPGVVARWRWRRMAVAMHGCDDGGALMAVHG